MHLTPADYVIFLFGGVRRTARLLGVAPSTVSRWSSREDKYGHAGLIPVKWHGKLIKAAKKLNIALKEKDLAKGKRVKK